MEDALLIYFGNRVSFFTIVCSNTNSLQLFCESSSLNLKSFKELVIFCFNSWKCYPSQKNILHKCHKKSKSLISGTFSWENTAFLLDLVQISFFVLFFFSIFSTFHFLIFFCLVFFSNFSIFNVVQFCIYGYGIPGGPLFL